MDRTCIFCGKSSPEVSFQKEAHVIPAALANRTLFTYCECDVCNENYFSHYENEMANYLMLDRVFIRARKRKGFPKYKPSGKESFIEGKTGTNTVNLSIKEEEETFEIIDKDDGVIILKINDAPMFRPADICKTMAHMGWLLLPEEKRNELPYVADWLLGKVDIFPLTLDIVTPPGNGFAKVILELWESEDPNSDYPISIRFTFGRKILTFYLPKNPEIKTKPVPHNAYIQLPDNDCEIEVNRFNIKDNGRFKPDELSYTLRYESKDPKQEI